MHTTQPPTERDRTVARAEFLKLSRRRPNSGRLMDTRRLNCDQGVFEATHTIVTRRQLRATA